MNYSIIRYVVGYVLKVEAAMLLLPVIVDFIHGEDKWYYYQ